MVGRDLSVQAVLTTKVVLCISVSGMVSEESKLHQD